MPRPSTPARLMSSSAAMVNASTWIGSVTGTKTARTSLMSRIAVSVCSGRAGLRALLCRGEGPESCCGLCFKASLMSVQQLCAWQGVFVSQMAWLGAQSSRVRCIPESFYAFFPWGFREEVQELLDGTMRHKRSVSLERQGMEDGKNVQSPQAAWWGHSLEVRSRNAKGNIWSAEKKIINFLPLKLEYTEQGSQEQHLWRFQFEMHFELGLIKA